MLCFDLRGIPLNKNESFLPGSHSDLTVGGRVIDGLPLGPAVPRCCCGSQRNSDGLVPVREPGTQSRRCSLRPFSCSSRPGETMRRRTT